MIIKLNDNVNVNYTKGNNVTINYYDNEGFNCGCTSFKTTRQIVKELKQCDTIEDLNNTMYYYDGLGLLKDKQNYL